MPDYLVIITLDGVRTTELFEGSIGTPQSCFKSAEWADEATYQSYWPRRLKRRETDALFGGEWMSQHGSVIGNRALGSQMDSRNRHRFFYPGYSEILTGQPDPNKLRVMTKSRALHRHFSNFSKRVATAQGPSRGFLSWDTIRYIVEQKAGSLFINSGFEP